jgi:hypothetical protein
VEGIDRAILVDIDAFGDVHHHVRNDVGLLHAGLPVDPSGEVLVADSAHRRRHVGWGIHHQPPGAAILANAFERGDHHRIVRQAIFNWRQRARGNHLGQHRRLFVFLRRNQRDAEQRCCADHRQPQRLL